MGGPVTRVLINLAVTLIVGFIYFYLELPALNPQAPDFYAFVLLLCVVYWLRYLYLRLPGSRGQALL